METFLSRSKRTDKAQWVREAFLGATPQHRTLSEEKEERNQSPKAVAEKVNTVNLGQQLLDLSLCLKHVYDNYALSKDTKKWIRELVPDIKPPKPRKRAPFKLDAVEVDGNKVLVWLLRNSDGRVFVELELVLQLLGSGEPLEAYTNDESFAPVPVPSAARLGNGQRSLHRNQARRNPGGAQRQGERQTAGRLRHNSSVCPPGRIGESK